MSNREMESWETGPLTEDLSSLEQLAEENGMTVEEMAEVIQGAADALEQPRPDVVDDDWPVPRPEPLETVEYIPVRSSDSVKKGQLSSVDDMRRKGILD